MKKATHWWLVVWKNDGAAVNNCFSTRREAHEWKKAHDQSWQLSKVIKVVAASTVTAETKQPWVDVVLRTVR